jgi:DNA-binding NarL/FixJ family response regulator
MCPVQSIKLTGREQEIYNLVAKGYDTNEIANYLKLSRRTIEVHRSHIIHKMGLPGMNLKFALAYSQQL